MQYREIGKTGMSASVVGLGAEHLQGKSYGVVEEVICAALDRDVNIMDCFMPGAEVRRNIGKAIAGRRGELLIQGHIGSTERNGQNDICRDPETCKRYFEELLRCLFDAVFEGGIVEYALKLKKEGTIRALGASSHNPVTARRVVETGLVDMIMFSVNPAYDMTPARANVLDSIEGDFRKDEFAGIAPERAALYALCERRNVGITAMKSLGAGKLLSKEHSPFGRPMTVGQCIHYALSRPAVASVLVGCASGAQVAEAVRYLELTEEERDYSSVIEGFQGGFKGSCVYCNHCLPCPSGIDIAAVNRYLDIALLDAANVPPSVRQHYFALKAGGGDCVSCGSCEAKCPFSVAVIDRMAKAAEIFGR